MTFTVLAHLFSALLDFLNLFARSECEKDLDELHLDFLVALCERWYGEKARRTVTSSDLLSCGFDARA